MCFLKFEFATIRHFIDAQRIRCMRGGEPAVLGGILMLLSLNNRFFRLGAMLKSLREKHVLPVWAYAELALKMPGLTVTEMTR